MFLSLFVLLQKKFTLEDSLSLSLSFASRSSEYARIKDHHGAFCDDDDTDAIVVLFILFVFAVHLSLSLSLSLSSLLVIGFWERRVNGLFLSSPSIFKNVLMSFRACLFHARKIKPTTD